jgi:effector-binding domain-containing protein
MSVVEVPEVRVIAIRGRHRAEDVPAFIGASFNDLFGHLGLVGVQPAGPPFVLYHAFGPDGVDADVCVPVAGPVESTGRIEAHVLLPVTCVRTLHVGPYDALSGAYTELTEWVDDHDYRPEGPVRERYLNGPGDTTDPSEYRTEIEMPVVLAASPEPVLSGR